MNPGRQDRAPRLVRPYTVTGGRASPTRNTLDLITIVRSRHVPAPPAPLPEEGLSPEQERVVSLCEGGDLTVAEIASWLALPVSVTKVVVSDLIDSGHVTARSPLSPPPPPPTADGRPADAPTPVYAQRTDAPLLEKVLDGLRNL
jgi:hypothetical protein